MLVDTHSHLYWESFKEDFDEIIQRCLDSEVNELISVGVDVETSEKALRLIEKIETVIPAEAGIQDNDRSSIKPRMTSYSSIGIHPHEATKYLNNPDVSIQKDIKKLENIYRDNPEKVKLVGECGLDYLVDPSFIPPDCTPDQIKKVQQKLLQAQIDLAKKLNLPLTIHVRDDRSKNPENSQCWDKVIEMTRNHFGIFHCYSGLPKTTDQILKTDFLVSFAATITYPKNEYLREAAKMLPLEKIVLETDCPFLPPQSKRGQRNEPSSIKEIAQLIAKLKNLSFEQVENQTSQNIHSLLGSKL